MLKGKVKTFLQTLSIWILWALFIYFSFLNTFSSLWLEVIVPTFNPAVKGRIEGSSLLNSKSFYFHGHGLWLFCSYMCSSQKKKREREKKGEIKGKKCLKCVQTLWGYLKESMCTGHLPLLWNKHKTDFLHNSIVDKGALTFKAVLENVLILQLSKTDILLIYQFVKYTGMMHSGDGLTFSKPHIQRWLPEPRVLGRASNCAPIQEVD